MLYNHYYYFKEIFNAEICQEIINLGLSQIEENKKNGITVFGTTAGDGHKQAADNNAVPQEDKDLQQLQSKNVKNHYVRDSEVAFLNKEHLYDLIVPYVNTANTSAGWNYQIDQGEQFQFTVYKPGGFYGWHYDSGMCNFSKYKRIIPGITEMDKNGKYPDNYVEKSDSRIGKIRKLSTTINLNSPGDYEGGNLKFDFGPHTKGERYHEAVEIRPQGSMIVFPSFIHHQVTPVTVGTRYSLVLWSLGKPFK